jgi:hypothetical protein
MSRIRRWTRSTLANAGLPPLELSDTEPSSLACSVRSLPVGVGHWRCACSLNKAPPSAAVAQVAQ